MRKVPKVPKIPDQEVRRGMEEYWKMKQNQVMLIPK